MDSLAPYGWTASHQQAWGDLALDELQPARVVADFGTSLKLAMPETITAELSGKLAHYTNKDEVPKVGDWVAVRRTDNTTVVESVVLRGNEIARKVTGKRTTRQIIATNVDVAFVLLSLDNDFSIERLNRFLFQLKESSVEAVIVLNKADKTNNVEEYLDQLASLSLPVITAIAKDDIGIEEIASHIQPGKTAILLGSSGVGKSTLTNKLVGRDTQATGDVRDSDSSGRHTTVHRELFILPNGGILIDTPGIRELQLWGTEESLETAYDDIVSLAAACRFRNCQHTTEAGCKITAALASGELKMAHYQNYQKMKAELAALAARTGEKIKRQKQHAKRVARAKITRSVDE